MKEKQKIFRSGQISTKLYVRENKPGEKPSRTITGYAIIFGKTSAPLWSDEDSEAREIISKSAITKELLDRQDIKFTMFPSKKQQWKRYLKLYG